MPCCKNKKVILTGATGLIGKEAIKPLLDKGFEVYALTIDEVNPNCGVNWIKTNIFDSESVKNAFETVRPSYLMHFAWAASGDYLISNINFDFLRASLDMLKHFYVNGGERAVFAGTCFEYDFSSHEAEYKPLNELTSKVNPVSIYAQCKNHLHQIATNFCKQNNINFGWGRIFYVYGKNEQAQRLTPYIINSLKEGKEVSIKSGKLIKDYMYTKDIAAAFVSFLDSGVTGPVNICTGKPLSIEKYVRTIASKLNKEYLLKFEDEKSNQPPAIVGDNSRLLKEVRFKPKYDLNTALDEILEVNLV